MMVFWALVIVGVVWLVRGGIGDGRRSTAKSASELLDERLPSGEISVEEIRAARQSAAR